MYHFSTDLKLLPLPKDKFQCGSMSEPFLVHWSICLLRSLIICFANWQDKSHPLCCFCKIALVILAYLSHHMNFKISLSSFRKGSARILIGITLSVWISSKKIGVFTMLSLPANVHFQSRSSFMSFRDVLWFSGQSLAYFLISVFLGLLLAFLSTENRIPSSLIHLALFL